MLRLQPSRIVTPLLAAACASAGAPASSDGAQEGVVVDGVRYSADTRILETFPVALHTTGTVTNIAESEREITFPGGCVVLLRAYRDPARTGRPAWDQERVAVCTMQIIGLRLAPGESEQYRTQATASEILGDSLPAGRYYLTALLRPNGRAVEVPAGEAELR